ncbi:MAG: tyrosine--tRNA ligase [bacterium]
MPITDQKQIKDILERGVEKIYPDPEKLSELLKSGTKLKIYCGFDPSAKSLHIGNAVLINKLAQFQALGHEVIFLIGDFTGMIGDPTDKQAVRKTLTRKEAKENSKNYKAQASKFLQFSGSNKAKLMYNSKWQDKLNFKDLIELASHFTVQQMIQRDMFQERLKTEKPIYLHEFLYPLAQGYDSVVLDVDLEIGGNDQMFNMMAGRNLMKQTNKKEKFVLTLKLLVDGDGNKMGKTTGNALFLDIDAQNMYGIIMSWPDDVIALGFELCTKVPFDKVKEIKKQLADPNINPRDLKMKLALEITKIVHGEDKANQAREHFVSTVQNKEIPDKIPEIIVGEGTIILDAAVKYFANKRSNGEIRRLFTGGGVTINNHKIDDFKHKVKDQDIVKIGKRDWFKVKTS